MQRTLDKRSPPWEFWDDIKRWHLQRHVFLGHLILRRKRGTWMHNFTFYHEIKKITHLVDFVSSIAVIFALVSIVVWLLGAFLLIKSKI